MSEHLTVDEVLRIHERVISESGGSQGVRDLEPVRSAVNQPRATFAQTDLYPTLGDKAAIMAFIIARGHPFVDGNKRTAQTAMEMFLLRNGCEIEASVDEQEKVLYDLADGSLSKEHFTKWVKHHTVTHRR